MNEIEHLLWSRLRRRQLGDLKFVTQIPVAGFHPDFLCRELKLAIELDGSQHADNFAYDERRTRILEREGYTVLRFWNSDVLTNMGSVLEMILHVAAELKANKAPPPACGRGPGEGRSGSTKDVASGAQSPSPDPSRRREGSQEA